MTSAFDFDDAFRKLTGHSPFPWQRRLFDEWLSCGGLPPAVDIPTGLGKTAVMALWLLARAAGAALPRRLVYVVDRRAVVDQATEFAEQLRDALQENEALQPVRQGLRLCSGPLAISTLRGRYVDNREWMADPAAPAIIIGTVDMVGSRLLFEGYGVSRRMRPYAAGLMGCDSLVMLDEAHLARPFEHLLRTIEQEQRPSSADGPKAGPATFAGSAASGALPPPFRLLPLSATMGHDASSGIFGIEDADREDKTVRMRLDASKVLTIEDLDEGSDLDEVLARRAWHRMQEATEASGMPVRMLIYCDRRRDVEKSADRLRDLAKKGNAECAVILFVGGRRVHERERAADELRDHGLIAGGDCVASVFVVATSAGEVGVDLDADHMICDLVAWERMVQRLGRVNRRGTGHARVLVIDQGPPDEETADKTAPDRHKATRALLESLPRNDAGGYQAGPAALVGLRGDPKCRDRVVAASTHPPLCPALTRPLVDAWSMTSLNEHTGRPEVGPWLRGWEKDEPQTIVIWRRYLPVFFVGSGTEVHRQPAREVAAFFEAAPPYTDELLETETWRVKEWLRKRARKVLGRLDRESEASSPSDDHGTNDGDPPSADGAPMQTSAPVVFLLDRAGRPVSEGELSLLAIDTKREQDLLQCLAGHQLVVDARLGGIKEGLLDDGSEDTVHTIDDNWDQPEPKDSQRPGPRIRVRTLTDHERAKRLSEHRTPEGNAGHTVHPWREALAIPYRASPEGDATAAWLVVEHRRDGDNGEEARAITSKAQRLDEHQAWAANEAAQIADGIGLDEHDRTMLTAAARHHDDGKEASRWQRAFNARREGGPYAKTAGPFNRHVLNGYRHELKSALDAETNGLDGIDRSDPRFELALHLIASHHGYARPAIGIEGYDDLPPSAAANRAHRIALRFAWLQGQWGPWGLAWWEALLRAADQRASRALEVQAARERTQPEPGTGLQRQMLESESEEGALMAEASIPVDLSNPGQVFACLGFIETAGVLLGAARGGFDWQSEGYVRFRLSAIGDGNPIGRVLRFLDEATVTAVAPSRSANNASKWRIETVVDDSGSFPFGDPSGPGTLPARLTDASGHSITIDHWGDETHRRDRVKFWAGAGGYPGVALARDALKLIRGRAPDHADDPFSLSDQQSSSFRFDWRRDYVPMDAGFSPNEHKSTMIMQGYPIVELLAAIGLTNARPRRLDRLKYSYGVPGVASADLYDPIFLRAALGSKKPPFPGMPFRLFTMKLDWPGREGQARCITNVIEESQPS